MRASLPSNRKAREASRIARPELLLPGCEAWLGRHPQPLIEAGRAGDRLRVDLERDATVATGVELGEAGPKQRLADSAAAERPADTHELDVAEGRVLVGVGTGDKGSGELGPVPGQLPEIRMELGAGLDVLVEPRLL